MQRDFDASPRRIVYTEAHPDDSNTPEPEAESDEGAEEFWNRHAEWQSSRLPKQPEPDTFNPAVFPSNEEYDLRTRFQDKGHQVIVKLANVELIPDKPRYEGGSWHVEGQMVRYALSYCSASSPNSIPERAHLRDSHLLLLVREHH